MDYRTRYLLAGLTTLTILVGCGGAPDGPPPKPIGVVNPNPDDPLKEVSLDNESSNMDKIRKLNQQNDQKNNRAKTAPVERVVY